MRRDGRGFPAKHLIPRAVIYSKMFSPHEVPTKSNGKGKKMEHIKFLRTCKKFYQQVFRFLEEKSLKLE